MNDNEIIIIDDNNNEIKMNIILTFQDKGIDYVLVNNPLDKESVYAFSYTEDGQLFVVEDKEILALADEVLAAFEEEEEHNA